MTMMIEDLAHQAFRACRDDDRETMRDSLQDIFEAGQIGIDLALQLWMDRVLAIVGESFDDGVALAVAVVSDDSDTGEPEPLDSVSDEIAWTARMFAAHALRQAKTWRRLWADIPFGYQFVYVERVLTTMSLTTAAYEEDMKPVTCCEIHAWITGDLAATGDRLAKAHLN